MGHRRKAEERKLCPECRSKDKVKLDALYNSPDLLKGTDILL